MLSRVADSLYWMARYLERSEHTARVLATQLNLSLDRATAEQDQGWTRVVQALGAKVPAGVTDSGSMVRSFAFDTANRASIVACIAGARENARQVREKMPSEMWEQLNRLYHEMRRVDLDDLLDSQPYEFLRAVVEASHLFQGTTDATLNHGEGWLFIQAGRSIERAFNTATLMEIYFEQGVISEEELPEGGDYLEWVGLLRSCAAFEAYCRTYTADVRPEWVVQFLLLNQQFPHSVCHMAGTLAHSLRRLQEGSRVREASRVNRLAGRLHASLQYAEVDELMGQLGPVLGDIKRQCSEIHGQIHEAFIAYPIESALEV